MSKESSSFSMSINTAGWSSTPSYIKVMHCSYNYVSCNYRATKLLALGIVIFNILSICMCSSKFDFFSTQGSWFSTVFVVQNGVDHWKNWHLQMEKFKWYWWQMKKPFFICCCVLSYTFWPGQPLSCQLITTNMYFNFIKTCITFSVDICNMIFITVQDLDNICITLLILKIIVIGTITIFVFILQSTVLNLRFQPFAMCW